MANTCDYCHKPLSLMRRLRGEQFCSVEHLDLYSAQQAEYALERLAASAQDTPATDRPPALIRPVSKPVTKKVLRPIGQQQGESAAPPPQAPARPTQIAVEPEPAPQTDPVYPMAPHIDQAALSPRTIETEAKPTPAGFAPVDTWGKVSQGWAMPPFHAEPGDPRTWNAGKLVSQIPPVAGLRELVLPKAPAATSTTDIHLDLIPLGQLEALLPSGWTGTEHPGVVPPLPVVERSISIQAGALRHTNADLTAVAARGQFVLAGVQIGFKNLPETAPQVLTGLRPRAVSLSAFGSIDDARFSELWRHDIALKAPSGPSLTGAASKRTELPARPGSSLEFDAAVAASEPECDYVLPQLAGWSWAPTFTVPQVALPELLPKPLPPSGPESSPEWQDNTGTVQRPALNWTPPHFGYVGPAFGWEESQPKLGSATDSSPVEPAQSTSSEAPRLKDFRARVQVGLDPASRQSWQDWQVLRTDSTNVETGPVATSRSTVAGPEVRTLSLTTPQPAQLGFAGVVIRESPASTCAAPDAAPMERAVEPAQGVRLRRLTTPIVAALETARGQMCLQAAAGVGPAAAETAGPVKYSPVALVVVPPPQFALKMPALADEQRYVAQAPNGVWRLPRIRHTGYRAVGPFPKLPVRMPEQPLAGVPAIHEAFRNVPRTRLETKHDSQEMPNLATPAVTRLHPADYFSWPVPKGMKPERMLPERESTGARPLGTRRFAPGRVGLQGSQGSADVRSRRGA